MIPRETSGRNHQRNAGGGTKLHIRRPVNSPQRPHPTYLLMPQDEGPVLMQSIVKDTEHFSYEGQCHVLRLKNKKRLSVSRPVTGGPL